ncbi:MAG: glycosyltransferase family 4 protein [Bacteroidales bacterium]|nr:glycosyltransferase family 4 protein [Bacteroidales bacterium]
MTKKLQILVLPSFFPAEDKRTKGIFIKEQVELLKSKYQIIVIYFVTRNLSLLAFLYEIFFKSKKRNYKSVIRQSGYNVWSSILLKLKRPSSVINFWNRYLADTINIYLLKIKVKGLVQHLNRENIKIDLVHAHTVCFGGIIANYYLKQEGTKYLITEHQALIFNRSYRINFEIQKAIRNCSSLLTVSHFQKKILMLQGIYKENTVIGNFVDDQKFILAKKNSRLFKILFITYPDLIKGNEIFFKSVQSLINKGHKNFRVKVLVNFDKQKTLQKWVTNHGMSEFFDFFYDLDRNRSIQMINNCSVLVSTSYSETFGLAVCEALMCGKPVVTSSSGGIDEMVTHENGIKVPIGDTKAVAEGILKIMSGEFKYDPVKIRKSVLYKYGREAFMAKMDAVYNNVLSSVRTEHNL